MNSRHRLALLASVALLAVYLLSPYGSAADDGTSPSKIFYVSPVGNDSWSGTLADPNAAKTDGPLATLEGAREVIRKMKRQDGLPQGGVIVELQSGRYERKQSFELTAEDSGRQDAPIVYRAQPGKTVRISGGKIVSHFEPVTDPDVLKRLDDAAKIHVRQADLRALGVTDYGPVQGGGIELFFNDAPMTLARWPNEGFTTIGDLVVDDGHSIHDIQGSKIGKFHYEGDRPRRWIGEKDGWLHGYWFWGWSDERQKIESIDPERHILAVVPPYHYYGYRKGKHYYAFNLLAELDSPGEWYVDRDKGILYFWPPAPLEKGEAVVSVLPELVTMRGASHVTLRSLIFEAARATAITIADGTEDTIDGCTLRNLGRWAVRIEGGKACGVANCDIHQTGEGGVALAGGDRKTLTPASHFARNNHIHHFSRWARMHQPGISLNGVGHRVVHNLIHDTPHMAVQFLGNDHTIELNEIHHVCLESNDAGAIYAGRDWTSRGNVIRNNFLHHVTGFHDEGCVCVYLDDQFSGVTVFGNVFYKTKWAILIGGGRDNTVENNIFVECDPAVVIDARGRAWIGCGEGSEIMNRLKAMPYKTPPWSERYPGLANILEDEGDAPKGNVIARNISQGGPWKKVTEEAAKFAVFQDNLVDAGVRFVDAAHMNFQLPDDSPVYEKIPGFKQIPFEQIGLLSGDVGANTPPQER